MNQFQEAEAELTSPSEAWSPCDTDPILPTDSKENMHNSHARNRQSNWEEHEFEPLEEHPSSGNAKLEEARKKREERKLLRQKELEARRVSRTTGGPMKLGAKKM